MSYDLQVLGDNRDALLLAEVAAWLHNLGKLEPRFLVDAIDGETPDNLPDVLRIPPSNSGLSQYSFRRFTHPSILQSDFPYTDLAGVLYFPEESIRQQIDELNQQLEQIRSELQRSDLTNEDRRNLGQKLNEVKQLRDRTNREVIRTEKSNWLQRERRIEQSIISSLYWPLGALLTMFWESEWFDKPHIENYQPGSEDDPDYKRTPKSTVQLKPGFSMDLPTLLLLAHGEVSGQEKKGLDKDGQYVDVKKHGDENPFLAGLRLSTAFGFEGKLDWQKWQRTRRGIVDWTLKKWDDPLRLKAEMAKCLEPLSKALGDTQRPINEITLWDYSASTAALFKTAVAQKFLTGQMPTPATMRWRLASIRLDAFDFLFQANQVADLVARRRLLTEAYRIIAQLLEIESPIASQVYSDEHGLVVVLPEWPGMTEEQLEDELSNHILEALEDTTCLTTLSSPPVLYGAADVRPIVTIGPAERGKKVNLQAVLSAPLVESTPSPEQVARWWSGISEDRCTVCGLRPIGYMESGLPHFVTREKAKERRVCGVCLARRGRRAEDWAKSWQQKQVGETIWIDEVADINGRFALIVGQFDLDDWLNGVLVRSLAIGTDEKGNWLSKPPTFARIFRIWRTTKQFWKEVQEKTLSDLKDDRRRLTIFLDREPDLGQYHVYDMDVGPTSLSVAWIPSQNEQPGYLASTDNLQYTARQLGADAETSNDPALSAIFVEDFIKREWIDGRREPRLRNPEGAASGRQSNLLSGYKLTSTRHQDAAYAPVIPILAEPRTFMALVPANKAIDVVQAIKAKYEREMGKVRNRLPLHLGVVYAGRRTPLASVLDAGRRMLRQQGDPAGWRVKAVRTQPDEGGILPERFQEDIRGQFAKWYEIDLEKDGRQLTWYVPAVMGDGKTEDAWYPYVFLDTDAEPTDRDRRFQAPNPFNPDADGKPQLGWLVHAEELQKDALVYFTPSAFDFEYLDVSARRFEVAYGDNGRRLGQDKQQRLYLLEEVDAIEKSWKTISKALSTSQIKALEAIIESKRQDWKEPSGAAANVSDAFRQFVVDALRTANVYSEDMVQAALSGMLADALEIHMTIQKEKTAKDSSQKETSHARS